MGGGTRSTGTETDSETERGGGGEGERGKSATYRKTEKGPRRQKVSEGEEEKRHGDDELLQPADQPASPRRLGRCPTEHSPVVQPGPVRQSESRCVLRQARNSTSSIPAPWQSGAGELPPAAASSQVPSRGETGTATAAGPAQRRCGPGPGPGRMPDPSRRLRPGRRSQAHARLNLNRRTRVGHHVLSSLLMATPESRF